MVDLCSPTSDPLAAIVYVITDEADGHYEPRSSSPVRVTPPYGTKLHLIGEEGDWAKIRFVGKDAWVLRQVLSNEPPLERKKVSINVFYRTVYLSPEDDSSRIHYGPKGGRFTLSKGGSKRYF